MSFSTMGIAALALSVAAVACTSTSVPPDGGGGGGSAIGGGSSTGGGSATGGGGSATGGGGGSDGGVCTTCFLAGRWQIDNLSPCFLMGAGLSDGGSSITAVLSTVNSGGSLYQCPADLTQAPSTPWSTDSLKVDCPGHYRLCFTLKAGDGQNPQAADCALVQVCADGDFTSDAGTLQTWTPLPGFFADGGTCAEAFVNGGGYGEASVTGTANACGSVENAQLFRVDYCPLVCNGANPPAYCQTCTNGSFNF